MQRYRRGGRTITNYRILSAASSGNLTVDVDMHATYGPRLLHAARRLGRAHAKPAFWPIAYTQLENCKHVSPSM